MRLAVLLLIAFAQRLCGAEDVCDGLVSEAVSFVPVVGNVRDLGCGLQKSDAWEVAFGAGGLVADVVSFGAYSSAKAAAKVAKAVRAGKKGESLVKAARTSKNWWTASSIANNAVNWFRRAKGQHDRGKVPVVGHVKEIGRGVEHRSAWDVASGAGGLMADGVAFGASASEVASTREKGESLVKATRNADWWASASDDADVANRWLSRARESLGDGVKQDLRPTLPPIVDLPYGTISWFFGNDK